MKKNKTRYSHHKKAKNIYWGWGWSLVHGTLTYKHTNPDVQNVVWHNAFWTYYNSINTHTSWHNVKCPHIQSHTLILHTATYSKHLTYLFKQNYIKSSFFLFFFSGTTAHFRASPPQLCSCISLADFNFLDFYSLFSATYHINESFLP